MIKPSVVVIDAGVGIYQVVAGPLSIPVYNRWSQWIKEGCDVCAPQFWLNETTSVLHKMYKQNLMDKEMAKDALGALLGLEITLHEADAEICRRAFDWADRMDQYAAYDGFYLALAEQLQAELWTTDKRLVNRARQLGVGWVYRVEE